VNVKKCVYYIDGQCAFWSVGVGKPLPKCEKDSPYCNPKLYEDE